jgi:lactoylglutathione lyase
MFRFDHIALYVSNLEKSVYFYRSIFELTSIPNPFPSGKAWFLLDKEIQLHLIENEANTLSIPERSHFCFSVVSLDKFLEKLRKNKIDFSDFDGNVDTIRLRTDGIQQIYFQDPDGYCWEVNDAWN